MAFHPRPCTCLICRICLEDGKEKQIFRVNPEYNPVSYTHLDVYKRQPHSGMAVSSDRGDSLDVHPKQKREVGERLAAWALNKTYGYKNVIPSGPRFNLRKPRSEKPTNLYLVCRINNKQVKLSTGVKIYPCLLYTSRCV